MSEHAQHYDPGGGSPKWKAALINVINPTCAFPALTSQNVRRGTGLLTTQWCVISLISV